MTDKEKLSLIDRIIADFWEWHTEEERNKGAICVISAIASVTQMEDE